MHQTRNKRSRDGPTKTHTERERERDVARVKQSETERERERTKNRASERGRDTNRSRGEWLELCLIVGLVVVRQADDGGAALQHRAGIAHVGNEAAGAREKEEEGRAA